MLALDDPVRAKWDTVCKGPNRLLEDGERVTHVEAVKMRSCRSGLFLSAAPGRQKEMNKWEWGTREVRVQPGVLGPNLVSFTWAPPLYRADKASICSALLQPGLCRPHHAPSHPRITTAAPVSDTLSPNLVNNLLLMVDK